MEQHVEVPTVTPETFSATRCPATPSKVATAFWPGVAPADSDTGGPPTAIAAVASAGTS
jgi:hypothetical protein